jgi:hypothetical protein
MDTLENRVGLDAMAIYGAGFISGIAEGEDNDTE